MNNTNKENASGVFNYKKVSRMYAPQYTIDSSDSDVLTYDNSRVVFTGNEHGGITLSERFFRRVS